MKRILVIGETCLDVFVYGSADRLCPEAPVPVFRENKSIECAGMASNVYRNVIECVGDLNEVGTVNIVTNDQKGSKVRYIDSSSNHMFLRVDSDTYEEIKKVDLTTANIRSYDAVIVSDYDKGFLTDRDLCYIGERAKLSFIDTKKEYNPRWGKLFDFIKINKKEYTENGFKNLGLKNLIVTLGSEGCKFRGKKFPLKMASQVRDVSGAGDTFLAAFACSYLYYGSADLAIDYAQSCCSIVVGKAGTATI